MSSSVLAPSATGRVRRLAVPSARCGKLCGVRPLPSRARTAFALASSREQGVQGCTSIEAAPSMLERVKTLFSSTAAKWLGALALVAVMVRRVSTMQACRAEGPARWHSSLMSGAPRLWKIFIEHQQILKCFVWHCSRLAIGHFRTFRETSPPHPSSPPCNVQVLSMPSAAEAARSGGRMGGSGFSGARCGSVQDGP